MIIPISHRLFAGTRTITCASDSPIGCGLPVLLCWLICYINSVWSTDRPFRSFQTNLLHGCNLSQLNIISTGEYYWSFPAQLVVPIT